MRHLVETLLPRLYSAHSAESTHSTEEEEEVGGRKEEEVGGRKEKNLPGRQLVSSVLLNILQPARKQGQLLRQKH